MHYEKNGLKVNGTYGMETIVSIIKDNFNMYKEKKYNTIKILDDITQKIENREFDDHLFKQDMTQIYNSRGGFTDDEKEGIRAFVIEEVKNFLQNSKGDINRLEGLIKDWS